MLLAACLASCNHMNKSCSDSGPVPRTQILLKTCSLPCLSLSDELLQEQRADMDQFTSSISETPVDVRVSSEESDEIPPFRPFHPFPSLPENEGVYD